MHGLSTAVEALVAGIRAVATESERPVRWLELEHVLEMWREPHEGGGVESNYIDDNLDKLLTSHSVKSIFHISKLQPSEHSRRSIILARGVWKRVVAAIERAEIVAKLRSDHRRECAPPSFSRELRGCVSSTSKCK